MKIVLALGLLLAVTTCGQDRADPRDASRPAKAEASPSYQGLDSGAEPLHSAFEADRGKIRAVFLVSPT